MKRFTSFGTFFIVILLTSSLFASGVGLTGIGARATALGGAYRGIANDWSAMYWNPAGISQIQGMHFGASFEMITPAAKYSFSQNVPAFSVYRTGEIENEAQTFYIPAAGFVYSMNKFSFGLSFYAPFGLGGKWDAMNTTAYNDAYPETEFEDDLKIIDIHPTIAYQVNDKLSIGVGFSFVLSDIIIRTPVTSPNPLLFDPANDALKQGVLAPMGLTAETYNHILTEKELEGDGTGFGFNFGLKYNVTEDLSIGLSGNWYNDISLDGKIRAKTYFAKIDPTLFQTLSNTLDGMIALGVLTAEQKAEIVAVYSGQTHDKIPVGTKGDATLPLPMTLGGGIAYTGFENLLLTADISWTQWSAWDVIEIELADGTPADLETKWEDGVRFSAGLEYKVMDPLKIRAGYYTEPTAIPDQTLSITIPDINRRHAINIGASYCFGIFDLFASYERILIGDREVNKWEPSADMTDYSNMAGTYKMSVNNIMFGLGFNF